MRFTFKWNNGYWKLFDTWYYKDIDSFGLQKDAIHAAEYMNAEMVR